VYPNPTNGLVNIQLLADDLKKPDNILENLSSGLYYLQAVDQKGEGYSGKVMIQR